ncbi:hypothetical protein E2C01_057107 [Portunus trituberculatus]|uniref:Uncharacterized protein n=1 Tax=Portunus trituberculatus TaxID=210409 RepID=A0A5B7GZH3_PORTR|nr:hypothetical protein [Portunus trituberculatus]
MRTFVVLGRQGAVWGGQDGWSQHPTHSLLPVFSDDLLTFVFLGRHPSRVHSLAVPLTQRPAPCLLSPKNYLGKLSLTDSVSGREGGRKVTSNISPVD